MPMPPLEKNCSQFNALKNDRENSLGKLEFIAVQRDDFAS